jgi:AcrR family transcriptional regulator
MTRKTKEEVLEEYRCSSICEAAMSVIARKGVADATMQEIADEAGIAKGTLYIYFRDKDELLTKTADGAYARLIAELDAAFNSKGPLEERLTAIVVRQLEFFDQHRELFRAYIALLQRDGATHLRKPRMTAHASYVEQLELLFAEAVERGEVRDVEPRQLAALYSDCVRGVIVRRIEEKSKRAKEEQASFLVSFFLRGVQAQSVQEKS